MHACRQDPMCPDKTMLATKFQNRLSLDVPRSIAILLMLGESMPSENFKLP